MDSIEIILKKDSKAQDINLEDMSIESTESFKEILESLISIAKYEKDTNNIDLKIGVQKGSACQKLLGSEENLWVVYNKIKKASTNAKDRDNFYVNKLKVIKTHLDKKSDFQIVYRHKNNEKIISDLFTSNFRIKRQRDITNKYFHVEFIKGKLMQNGGANPNFHMEIPSGIITIECSESEAQKVNKFLYKQIYVSTWVEHKKDNKRIYNFCDLYATPSSIDRFQEFQTFFKSIEGKKGTEPLHIISDKLQSYYSNRKYSSATKFLRLFNWKEVDPNYLKTILVLSKNIDKSVNPEKNRTFISIVDDLRNLLNKKLGI